MLFLSGWKGQKDNENGLQGDINVGEHKKKTKKILENALGKPHCSMSNDLIPTAPSSCSQQTNTDKLAPPLFLVVNHLFS